MPSDADPAAPAPVPSAVDARRVSKRYPRIWALAAVDLRLEQGEVVALLGPNGSGKSTLLKVIAGLARPTSGGVQVFGAAAKSEGVRRRIGFLSHHTYLYDELTAAENLGFARAMYGLDASDGRVREALARVGLSHVADSELRTFSSGMRKRLALARATLHDPDIVLLDEPYGALDVEGIEWVDGFIDGLSEAGKTAIVATHETGRALALCQRVVALRDGRVAYDGRSAGFEPSSVAGASARKRIGA